MVMFCAIHGHTLHHIRNTHLSQYIVSDLMFSLTQKQSHTGIQVTQFKFRKNSFKQAKLAREIHHGWYTCR